MKTTSQHQISARQPGTESIRPDRASRPRCGKLARTRQMKLATSWTGRIALHLLVALKAGHYRWHWQGIVRELARV